MKKALDDMTPTLSVLRKTVTEVGDECNLHQNLYAEIVLFG